MYTYLYDNMSIYLNGSQGCKRFSTLSQSSLSKLFCLKIGGSVLPRVKYDGIITPNINQTFELEVSSSNLYIKNYRKHITLSSKRGRRLITMAESRVMAKSTL